MSSSICQWISDFLTYRTQHVKLGRHLLFTQHQSAAGCVLSPLLYSLYTNDCIADNASVKLLCLQMTPLWSVSSLTAMSPCTVERSTGYWPVAVAITWNSTQIKPCKGWLTSENSPPPSLHLRIYGSAVSMAESIKFLGDYCLP
jgi:hypothetical protein